MQDLRLLEGLGRAQVHLSLLQTALSAATTGCQLRVSERTDRVLRSLNARLNDPLTPAEAQQRLQSASGRARAILERRNRHKHAAWRTTRQHQDRMRILKQEQRSLELERKLLKGVLLPEELHDPET